MVYLEVVTENMLKFSLQQPGQFCGQMHLSCTLYT